MKRDLSSLRNRLAKLAAAAALAVVAGCGERPPAAETTAAAPPVQGDLITAPLPAAVPEVTTNAVAAAAVAPAEPATPDGTAPAAAAAATAPPAPLAGAGTPQDPFVVGFDKLAAFAYTVPDGPVETNAPAGPSQIPDPVRALDGKFVSLKGFMLPLKVEKGLVTELLLMRDQSMCCYGVVPKINEWVSVKMTGAGVKPTMDSAVTLHGTMKVGEIYESGYLVGIYAMDGEEMRDALDL
jgi:hypothetical protein